MKVKVAFDHQAFVMQSYGGVSRYFVNLAEALQRSNKIVKVFAPFHKNRYLSQANSSIVNGKFYKRFPSRTAKIIDTFNRLKLKKSIHQFKPDILHETYYYHNKLRNTNVKTVVTVYDMIHELFPESFPENDITRIFKKNSVDNADHIICISNSTKNDLMDIHNIPSEKISVVHLAAEKVISPNQFQPFHPLNDKKPYILFVGERGGYKNFTNFLHAIGQSKKIITDFNIVTFGGGQFSPHEIKTIDKLGFKENQVLNISGDDQLLASLYKSARLFVYPSMYEGFGLPLLEAMINGCPVISANNSSLPEVAGNAARYFNPYSIEEISQIIEEVAYSDYEIEKLKSLSKIQVGKFSWKKCAEETSIIYDNLL